MPHRSTSMRSDVVTTMFSNVGGILVGLIVTFAGPRILDRSEFAMLGWTLSAVYVLGSLATFGLPLRLVADVPRLDREAQTRFIAHSVHLTAVSAGVIAVLLGLVSVVLPTALGRDAAPIAPYAAALIIPAAILSVESACFRARGNFRAAAVTSEQLTRIAWLVGLLVAVATVATARVTVSFAIGVLLCVACVAYVMLGITPTTPRPSRPMQFVRETLPFAAGALGGALLPQAGVLTLSTASDQSDVAEFTASLRLVMLCTVIATASSRVIGPRVSAHRGSGDELTRLVRPIATLVFWSTVAIAAPVVAGGPPLMRLLFGPTYGSSWAPAAVMLIGVLVNTFTGPAGWILYSHGRSRLVGRTTLIGGLSYLPVGALAARAGGSVAVGASSSLIVSALVVWQASRVYREFGCRSWASLNPLDAWRSLSELRRSRSGPAVK